MQLIWQDVELQVRGIVRRLSSAKTETVICQGTPLCVLGGGVAWAAIVASCARCAAVAAD